MYIGTYNICSYTKIAGFYVIMNVTKLYTGMYAYDTCMNEEGPVSLFKKAAFIVIVIPRANLDTYTETFRNRF